LYGGTFRLFDKVRRRSAGHRFTFVDLTDLATFEAALQDDTRMVCVETPSNPLLRLSDLAAIARICRERGIICVADNTFASPWIQRPLELGFDIVVHSTTKYLNGHSDVIGGIAVVGQNAELAERLGFLQNAVGAIAGPFDAFLTLRGVKTLALRMERHCSNALDLAQWLELQPQVARVYYPGLPSHPQHELARQQMHGFGGMISLDLYSRKPDRAPGDHDPRHYPRRNPRATRHRRCVGAFVSGRRGRRRPARRPGSGAGADVSNRRKEPVLSRLLSL
jgi:cystathionine gamma-lyase